MKKLLLRLMALFLTIGSLAPTLASASLINNGLNPWWCEQGFGLKVEQIPTNRSPVGYHGECLVQARSDDIPGLNALDQVPLIQFGGSPIFEEIIIHDFGFSRGNLTEETSLALGSLLRYKDWGAVALSVIFTEIISDGELFNLESGNFYLLGGGISITGITTPATSGEVVELRELDIATLIPAMGYYTKFALAPPHQGGGFILDYGWKSLPSATPSPAPLALIFLGIAILAHFARQRRVKGVV